MAMETKLLEMFLLLLLMMAMNAPSAVNGDPEGDEANAKLQEIISQLQRSRSFGRVGGGAKLRVGGNFVHHLQVLRALRRRQS